ncbi:MAG: hypothetical protein B7X54_10855, partial [Idiomarina sp. 34-48-12]
ATTDTARGEKRLPSEQNQAILKSSGRPLGECRLEAQLRQAQRLDAIGQLTGGVAHDFNNLLTVILGNSEMLVDILPPEDLSAAMAAQIMAASERAAQLTQRLLAFARKQPLSPKAFDVNSIIEDLQVLIERSITPAIELELKLAEDLAKVYVDRSMFESALLNICVNARDSMPNGGLLRIETSAETLNGSTKSSVPEPVNYVRVVVSDTGEGMDQKTLVQAVEPFFTTKSTGQGSGLGLSMVHGFVHQSGGLLRIQSDLKKGTIVELLLLPHSQPLNACVKSEVEIVPAKVVPHGRILVVEDEDRVREYICLVLRECLKNLPVTG